MILQRSFVMLIFVYYFRKQEQEREEIFPKAGEKVTSDAKKFLERIKVYGIPHTKLVCGPQQIHKNHKLVLHGDEKQLKYRSN